MNYKPHVIAAACLALGLAIGLAASDVAAYTGFPWQEYELQLTQDQTPESLYLCTRFGVVLGGNRSDYDFEQKKQANCVVTALGTPQPDGSFTAVRHSMFWYGRLARNDDPIRVPASRIKAITPVQRPPWYQHLL